MNTTTTDSLSAVFAALADPTRRAILAHLARGEAPVGVLAAPFEMSLPAISRHLKVLERSGLISRGRDAQWRPCRLEAGPMKRTADWLENYRQYWEGSFDRLDDYLRQLQAKPKTRKKEAMSQTPTATDTADRTLIITRVFDAPRSLVFASWTQKEHGLKWFAPSNCTMEDWGNDLHPGGAWHMAMRHPDGELYEAIGEYREIVQNERVVFTHAWKGDDGQPEHWTEITIELSDQPGGKTAMTFTQALFKSKDSRDRHNEGWSMCFDGLAKHLAENAP